MKKQLLSTLTCICLGVTLYAQVYDKPRPINENLLTSPLLDDKAGNYGQFCGNNLPGLATSNNGNDGVMFKVKAKENLYINGFSINMAPNIAAAGYLRIYKKSGTYVGFETNAAAWLLVDSGYVTPNNTIMFANGNPDAYVLSGTETSFYITGSGDVAVNYTDGVTEGAILSENSDLILYEGKGVTYPFAANFAPRNFVGKIHYCKATQYLCDTTGTTFNDDNGNSGVFFDVHSKNKEIYLDNIFADISGEGTGTLLIYSKTGSFQGSETNAAAWTLLDSAQLANPTNDGPEAIAEALTLTMAPNSTRGFHLVFTSTSDLSVDYTNGLTINDTIRTEQFIAITGGVGASSAFDNGFPNRKFHGTVSYCVDNTGIDENESLILNLYPNPTSEQITINTGTAEVREISIMDVSGKTVLALSGKTFDQTTQIDVSGLLSGTYFIKVVSKSNVSTQTFIKQ